MLCNIRNNIGASHSTYPQYHIEVPASGIAFYITFRGVRNGGWPRNSYFAKICLVTTNIVLQRQQQSFGMFRRNDYS